MSAAVPVQVITPSSQPNQAVSCMSVWCSGAVLASKLSVRHNYCYSTLVQQSVAGTFDGICP